MAWATLIIGAALLLMGILGQNLGMRGGRTAQADEKRAGLFALRIVSLLIGLWLLIYGVSRLIHAHHHQSGPAQTAEFQSTANQSSAGSRG